MDDNYAHNRGRLRLVYTRRQKTARVLYPTAQDGPSQGFSQGHFHHTSSQKPSPSLIVLCGVFRFSAASFNAVPSFIRNIFKPGHHLGTEI